MLTLNGTQEYDAWIKFAAARATIVIQSQRLPVPSHLCAEFADKMIEEMRKRDMYA